MASDDRLTPLAQVRLFDRTGDNIAASSGWGWYDTHLHLEQGPSRSDIDPAYNLTLERFPEVGTVLRPTLVLQDSRKTNYDFHNANDWEERRPSSGVPRRYRLAQFNTTANLQWYALSKFALPANPHCAFSFFFLGSPPDHDAATYPPYIRIELGGASLTPGAVPWALEFSQGAGLRLLRYDPSTSALVEALALDEPVPIGGFGGGAGAEYFLFLRHFRGRILVSTNGGRTYRAYDDGADSVIPAGKYAVRGQGGMTIHGLHQLAYPLQGVYTSPQKGMVGQVGGAMIPAYRGETAGGSLISIASLSMPPSYAQYTATLTRGTVAATPFTFHYSPALYSVTARFPPAIFVGSGEYTEPWEGTLLGIEIEKPWELDGASATIDLRHDAATAFTADFMRNRKIQIHAGWVETDGTTEFLTPVFTGYLTAIQVHQDEYGKSAVRLRADNVTWRAKSSEWEQDTTPLGGLTVNQALDQVLFSLGFTAADRVWHTNGNAVTLDPGSPEDPFLWPREGENKWDTMSRIARFAQCEIGVTDDGIWATVLKNYVPPAVAIDWQALPATDANLGIRQGATNWDFRQWFTGVIVRGEDARGWPVYASSIDLEAELDYESPRFAGWAQRSHLRLDGSGSQGMANVYCLTEAMDRLQEKMEPEIVVPVAPTVGRRMRVTVSGTVPLGVNAGDEFMVVSLKHTFARPQFRCVTTAGLRRIAT